MSPRAIIIRPVTYRFTKNPSSSVLQPSGRYTCPTLGKGLSKYLLDRAISQNDRFRRSPKINTRTAGLTNLMKIPMDDDYLGIDHFPRFSINIYRKPLVYSKRMQFIGLCTFVIGEIWTSAVGQYIYGSKLISGRIKN